MTKEATKHLEEECRVRSYAFPTVCGQTLRALARFMSVRVAFSWPGGSITYRGANRTDRRASEGLHATWPYRRRARRRSTANGPTPGGAGVRRIVATFDHLAASPRSLERSALSIEDSEARCLRIDAMAFRDRGGDSGKGSA